MRDLKRKDIFCSDEIERKTIDWCTLHFAQASATPLASPQWMNKLDLNNPNNILNDILEGKVPSVPEFKEVEEFFGAAMRMSAELDITLDFNHFASFSLKQQENKVSSPSKLHYGHMRTIAHDKDLLRLRFDIMNLALTHKIVLERWQKIWETLLPKEPPRTFIHRFRNITIVKWNVQYLMKTIWAKRLMSSVKHLLHPSQNAMAEKVPQSSILSHKLDLNTIFICGESSIAIENDASNCYDRILVLIATLASLRAGLPKPMAQFLTSFLSNAKHYPFWSGQKSRNYFSDNPTSRVDGTGQGISWSPTVWSLVANILITTMSNYAGMLITAPDGSVPDLHQIKNVR